MTRDDQELVRKYFDHELSEEEQRRFDSRMEDQEFADYVAEQTVRLYSRDKLKTEIANFNKDASDKNSNRNMWRIAAISIASLVLVGTAILFNISDDTIDSNFLFEEYFEPAPNIFKSRVESDSSVLSLFDLGMEAYELKDYSGAIELFEQARKEEASASLDFYLATSLILDKRLEEAEAILEERLKTNSPIFRNEMQWQLALIYIKKGDYLKAQQSLGEIKPNAAKELLVKRDKLLRKISE